MRYCHRPYEFFYMDHYNGNIHLCSWLRDTENTCVGNIFQQSIEEIYNGEKARAIRATFEDGTFSLCRLDACPFLQNQELPEISEAEYRALSQKRHFPTYFNLAYDFVCNQHCETCRPGPFIPPENYRESMDRIRDLILPYLGKAAWISATGHGDLFASPYSMELFSGFVPDNPGMRILIETNGSFFDPPHWERIKHLGEVFLEVIITFNSLDDWTFRHINRGGNLGQVVKNIRFVKTLREQGRINQMNSSFVVQDRNFRELPRLVDRSLNDFGFDRVIIKPVFQWGTMPEQVFWFKDVLNPRHPYHQEYLGIMQDPVFKDPRVYNFAGNMLHEARDFPASGPA